MVLILFLFYNVYSSLTPPPTPPDKQLSLPAPTAAADPSVQGLRPFRQSRHSCHLGAADRGRSELRVFPRNAQPDGPAAGRGVHPVGVLGRLRHVSSEKVFPACAAWQSVRET